MKKVFKFTGFFFGGLVLLAAAGVIYLKTALPNVAPAADLNIERTPERIARGAYLANSVMVCMDCHTQRDWSIYSGPGKPGMLGAGGELFDEKIGIPGKVYSRNITPYALGKWTDGEIFRAITTGVSRDGTPLFPLMPYENYSHVDKEDIYAVIAYLRTIPAVPNDVPDHELDFPLNLIVHTIPKEATFDMPRPAVSDTVNYGKYLVQIAGCTDCHTPTDANHKPIAELYLSGGVEIPLPNGVVRTANLTPSKETGTGNWSREQFVGRFKMYQDSSFHLPALGPNDLNTIMPWTMYSTMKDQDLTAIYKYLQTIKPVENQVVKFSKASL